MKLERVDLGTSPDRAGWVRLAGSVRYSRADDGLAAEDYWFEFPEEYAPWISSSGNPWLACLLPVAVERGEPLELSVPVDGRMLDAARELMLTWRWWSPRHAPVAIHADVAPLARDPGRLERTMSLFSGGVDSFYTVLQPRAAPIDDLLLIHGAFDLSVAPRDAFERVRAKLAAVAESLGMVLIPSATNLLHTRLGKTDLEYIALGSMLGAVPLALERRFARVLIPSSLTPQWTSAWGTHPITDAMMSTARTQVVNDGYPVSRLDKMTFVAGSDLALRNLRVCLYTGNETNCMRCEKCLRAAVQLEAMGRLAAATGFATHKLDLRDVRRMAVGNPYNRHYYVDIAKFSRERGRDDLASAIDHALRRAKFLDPFRPLVRKLRRHRLLGPATRWLESRVHDPGVTWHLPQ